MGSYTRAKFLVPGDRIYAGDVLDWLDHQGEYYDPDMRTLSEFEVFEIEKITLTVKHDGRHYNISTNHGELNKVPFNLRVFQV